MYVVVWRRLSGKSNEWERGYHQLPQGYYRVVIEATSGKGTEHLNIAVDDIWIGQCERGNQFILKFLIHIIRNLGGTFLICANTF